MRQAAVRDVRALAVHAMSMGARYVNPIRVEWDTSAGCEDPVQVELVGRTEARPQRLVVVDEADWRRAIRDAKRDRGTMIVEMWVPCRRCRNCLKRRAARWAARAHFELAAAPRTWFATFTAAPSERVKLQYRRDLRLLQGGTHPSELSSDEMFRELASEFGTELTKYFKRVRKETLAPLRYLLVSEAHKDGFPHFHALIHEVDAWQPLRHEQLSRQWMLGFSRFKLVPTEGKVAYYVCKYLAKSALTRVRASQLYGSPSEAEARCEAAGP